MNDDAIQQIFFVECEESLEAAEAGLDACKAGTQDAETINAIFRGVHSIKGGAGAFGHARLQAYTHCFENLLGEIREGAVELSDDLVDLLLHSLDLLRAHVEAARSGADAPDDTELMAKLEAARAGEDGAADTGSEPPASEASDADIDTDLDALLDELAGPDAAEEAHTASSESEPGASGWFVHIRPHAGAMDNGGEPLLWLRELSELGGVCAICDVSDVPPIHNLDVDQGYFGWTFRMPAEAEQDAVADIFDFAGDDCGIAYGKDAAMPPLADNMGAAAGDDAHRDVEPDNKKPLPDADRQTEEKEPAPAEKASTNERPARSVATSQSVRINLGKLDRLIDAVGELVIAQAMLDQRLENENNDHIEELAMIETLVRDIQEHAMAFRAQPINTVFGRVPRLLRELSGNTGKHVKLEVSGETTELDKTVIERLSEPLTHLIRNAVDHGIEPADERRAAGKEPEGTLTLSAEQKAGRIVIEISDDGRGIDRDKVLAKAISNGIVEEGAQLSDDEINQLIFAPGFSTAAQVSNISGRGVGMDVVKSNVRELGGRIGITSTPGKGSTFSLALPLTLAISDGMIVETGDQSLVIPLTHVIESLRPSEGDVKGMGTTRRMLNVRGRFVPILSLGEMTGASDPITNPSDGVLVLVETESHGQAALLVDAIADQRQFVIKSLDAHYRSVDSVAGATILGNGQVALIVDVDFLVQSANASAAVLQTANAA